MSGELPPLVAKALVDNGYDLISAVSAGWHAAGISGTSVRLLVRVGESGGVLLALPEANLAARIGLSQSGEPDATPPTGTADMGLASSAAQLDNALRMLHSLQTHPTDFLAARVEARLAAIPETERTREVRQRIGQDVFREALMDLWQGRCAITGLALPPELLRASHAKPWAKASDSERLDPFNGLLLAVHLDAMFDTGLIGFDSNGLLLCSERLDGVTRTHFGLGKGQRLRTFSPGHLPYLDWHREVVFKG